MQTGTLLWILGGTVALSFVLPALFPIILVANSVIILVWLFGGRGGGGSNSDHYDSMGPGDFGEE